MKIKISPHKFLLVTYLLFISLIMVSGVSAKRYNVVDIGKIKETRGSGWVSAINNSGQVVGAFCIDIAPDRYEYHAFFWENGSMTDLGLGQAHDINDYGRVVGWASPSSGDSHAFFWENGITTNLLPSEGFYRGINDLGHMVGNSFYEEAIIWKNGTVTIIDELPQMASANKINNNGQIAGSSELEECITHAIFWDNGSVTDFGRGNANDINRYGVVVGFIDPGTPNNEAFKWDGELTMIGTLNEMSSAYGINDLGQIVGISTDVSWDNKTATLWEDNVPIDLNDLIDPDLGIVLNGARDINNVGQIIGTGIVNGETHGFLLNPIPRADFSANPVSGPAPLNVNFTDQSIGIIDSWEWDFGDDSPVSYEQNPTHTYENIGLYNVSLTVTGTEGSDTKIKTDYIYATTIPCEGDFDGDSDVDGSDLSIFAFAFGTTDCSWWPPLCECDFDGDGDVDGSDLAVFAADFGRTDCP